MPSVFFLMIEFHLNQHKKSLLNSELTENQLVSLVQKISTQFTSQREKIGEYVSEEDLVSAYSYFYLPTNFPKFNFLMERLEDKIKHELSQCHFVDWGTGPGTYLLSFLNMFPDAQVTGVDSSAIMLRQAEKTLNHYFPQANSQFVNSKEKVNEKSNIYLNFGNSLNEMEVKDIFRVIDYFQPSYLSFIEPGTPAVFDKILKIRDYLGTKDFTSLYPCHSMGKCPMGEKRQQGIEEWCHQVLRLQHDPSVERFSQLAKFDRKVMPMTAHFYCKENKKVSEAAVIVRYLRETKFSFDYQVCLEKDGEPVLKTIELLKKSLSKQEVKEFKKASVGMEIEFQIQKEISPEHYKVVKK